MAEECVSMIPGIKELLADKGYDTNAIRAFLNKAYELSFQASPIARKKFATTRKPTKDETSSNAASVASKTSGALLPATTNSRKISFPRSVSSLSLPIGSDLIESGP